MSIPISPSFIDDYVKYFEEIAINHVEICHESAHGKQAFFRMNVQEVFGAWRTAIREKSIALIAVEYISQTKGITDQQVYSARQGGFLVVGHHKKDATEQLAILAKTERIAHEIINRIVHHSKNGHPLFNCSISDWNNFNLEPRYNEPDGNYAGWFVTFNFMTAITTCVRQSSWKDDLSEDDHLKEDQICP